METLRFKQVEEVLRTLYPAMEADGGGIDMFEVNGASVRVRLKGSCLFCPSYQLTLKLGIERTLKKHLDWVSHVESMDNQ